MLMIYRVDGLISDLDDVTKKDKAARVLIELGKYIIDDLIREMKRRDDDTSCSIAAIITHVGGPAVDALMKAVPVEENVNVQRRMIEILGMIGDARAVKPLLAVLESDNRAVYDVAIDALTDINRRQMKAILQLEPMLFIEY